MFSGLHAARIGMCMAQGALCRCGQDVAEMTHPHAQACSLPYELASGQAPPRSLLQEDPQASA